MTIPKQFKLFGQTITVDYDKNMAQQHQDAVGVARYSENKITLQPDTPGNKRNSQQIEQCFYHELVHHILIAMGEGEQSSNEKFVDVFASLLHQFETTKTRIT